MRKNDVDRIVLALVEEWQNNPSKYRVGRGDVIRFTPMQVWTILSDLDIEPEPIRCKDCKYNSSADGNYTICDVLPQMYGRNPEDNYCSGAERREE